MKIKKLLSKVGSGLSKLSFNKSTIEKVSLEDLSRERSKLSKEKEKLFKQQQELSKKEKQLMSEGKESSSNNEKKMIASRIRDIRNDSKVLTQRYNLAEKSYKIVSGVYTVKENEAYYEKLGLGSLLKDIPVENLVAYIEQAPAGAEDSVDQMQDILEALSESTDTMDSLLGDSSEGDDELDDIINEFDDFESDNACADDPDLDIFDEEEKDIASSCSGNNGVGTKNTETEEGK